MISVIIPTLNEEKYLPLLLENLKNRSFIKEVIVVDGNSSDKTCEVALNYPIRLFKTKMRNVSYQRNLGGFEAISDWLLFLDADIIPSNSFFRNIEGLIKSKKFKAGSAIVKVNSHERNLFDSLFCGFINFFALLFPGLVVRGAALLVKKDAFEQIGGFNESAIVAEDVDLVHRLKNATVLPWVVYESPRRYRKLGYLRIFWSWFVNGFSVKLRGKSVDSFWRPVR